jgi:hypothetical protein
LRQRNSPFSRTPDFSQSANCAKLVFCSRRWSAFSPIGLGAYSVTEAEAFS